MTAKVLIVDIGEETQLAPGAGTSGLSVIEGGLLVTRSSGTAQHSAESQRPRNAGKLYFVAELAAVGSTGGNVGVFTPNATRLQRPGNDAFGWGFCCGSSLETESYLLNNGTATNLGAKYTTGFIHVAVDIDAGRIWFGRSTTIDGAVTWFLSGNPTTGANPNFTNLTPPPLGPSDVGAIGLDLTIGVCPVSTATSIRVIPHADRIVMSCPFPFTPWGMLARVASNDFVSYDGDAQAPNTVWNGRMAEDPVYERRANCHVWSDAGGSAAPISQVTIDNTDGFYDYLLLYDVREAPMRARLGQDFGWSLGVFIEAAAGVVESVVAPNEQQVQFVLRDKGSLLEKPLQPQLFATTVPAVEMRGTPQPFGMGGPLQFTPILTVDAANLDYAVADGMYAVTNGYFILDNGVTINPLTGWEPAASRQDATGIRRLVNPAGKQTATWYGRPVVASTPINEGFDTWSGSPALPTGWSIVVGSQVAGTRDYTRVGSNVRCRSNGSAAIVLGSPVGGIVNNSVAWVEIKVTSVTSGSVEIVRLNGAAVNSVALKITRAGTYRFSASTDISMTSIGIRMAAGVTCDLQIDSILFQMLTLKRNTAELVPILLTGQSKDFLAADIDTASLATMPTYLMGYYSADQNATLKEPLDLLVKSCGAGYYFDRLGVLKFGRLVDPAGVAPVANIAADTIVGDVSVEMDTAPGLSTRWVGNKNYCVHEASEVAGVVGTIIAGQLQTEWLATYNSTAKLANQYRDRTAAPAIETAITNVASLTTEANRFCGLYTVPRFFYRFNAFVDDSTLMTLEPWQVVTVVLPRYILQGAYRGVSKASIKRLMVVGLKSRFLSNLVEFTCWG